MKEAANSVKERLDRLGRDESKVVAEKQGNQTIGDCLDWGGEWLCH